VAVGSFGYNPEAGAFPLERPAMLGIVLHELRRPSVMERWSPLEIAIFEGAVFKHGKLFHEIAKVVGTKSVQECIAFYYMWKKTSHYKQWKVCFRHEAAITMGSDGEEEEDDD
ncbi:unnamed protein product, partial [Phaeothamnion confervicola]